MEKLTQAPKPLAKLHFREPAQSAEAETNQAGVAGDTIAAMWVEVTDYLLSAALTTCAVNLFISHKQSICIDHIFRHLPSDPVVAIAVTRRLTPTNLDGATLDTLELLIDKIGKGKNYIKECKIFDGQCDERDWRELEDVALSWRQICALGIAALCRLEQSCKAPFWSSGRLRTLDKLVELLGNARDGESPYLGPDRCPLVPHWAEKRRQGRQLVNLGAKVRCDGETHNAIVADISGHGMGLDRVFGLRAGRSVAVELDDGRRVVGVVSWTAGGRAGIEFRDANDEAIKQL